MNAPRPINSSRLPHFWRGMGFTARAAWLVTAGLASDYSEACSMMARLPRKPKPRQVAADYWWNQ